MRESTSGCAPKFARYRPTVRSLTLCRFAAYLSPKVSASKSTRAHRSKSGCIGPGFLRGGLNEADTQG